MAISYHIQPSLLDDDTPRKQCRGTCEQWFPATYEYFYHNKNKSYGLQDICKDCWKIINKTPLEIIPPAPGAEKICNLCEKSLPATPEFFNRRHRSHDGLDFSCKKCRNERKNATRNTPEGKEKSQQYYLDNREHIRTQQNEYYYDHRVLKPQRYPPRELLDGEKWCHGCDGIYPATNKFFPCNKNYADGLHTHCKLCAKEYKEEHEEEMQAYYIQYRIENDDKIRQYRAEHKEEKVEYDRQYAQTERGKAVQKVKRNKRRAIEREVQGTHTAEDVLEQLSRQNYRCYYAACGFSKFKKRKDGTYIYTLEHTFPLTRVAGTDIPANDIGYLVLACKSCNSRKRHKYPWEWFEGGRLL